MMARMHYDNPNEQVGDMVETTLAGKVALVTGASRRIGAVIVRTLHAAGATVVVHYRHSEQDALDLQRALNTLRPDSCYVLPADLLDTAGLPALMDALLRQTGRLDILVNNASSFYPTPLGTITEAHWDDLLGTNLKAPLFLAQAAAPQLRENRGVIVNLVDIHGLRPLPEHSVYCVAKAGLVMLTQSLARELGPPVRVNAVAPGAIIWPEAGMPVDEQQKLLAKTALQRIGSPEDIAQAVLFLVKDAPYITGQVLAVEGGRMLNH